jgi:hypothetical protein
MKTSENYSNLGVFEVPGRIFKDFLVRPEGALGTAIAVEGSGSAERSAWGTKGTSRGTKDPARGTKTVALSTEES